MDGVKKLTPFQRIKLTKSLKINCQARPTRRVWIPKPGKKEKRPLGIPTMEDRAKQMLLFLALEPEWEARFEPNSYGFRPGRSVHDALRQIYSSITQKAKYVLDADIAKCFDKINHSQLLNKLQTIPKFRKQIKAWLKAGVIDFGRFQHTKEGTPQGGNISPLLANIALHGMETAINKAFPADGSNRILRCRSKFGKVVNKPYFVRYADDFVIICEELTVILKCKEIITEWLKTIGLELKPEKTRIVHTLLKHEGQEPGFDFLGTNIRQYSCGKHRSQKNNRKKTLGYITKIKPSQKNLQSHYSSVTSLIERAKPWSQEELIGKLNKIIRGYCNYHAFSSSRDAFDFLDYLLWRKLWSWASFRHPNKGKKWIYRKYWGRTDSLLGNRITFQNKKGARLQQYRDYPTGVKYIKVKGERSPYDGDDTYWCNRLGDKYKIEDKQKARLLKKQKGKCPGCGLKFKPNDVIEKHHIIPRHQGGTNYDKNMVLLHLHCHDLTHRRMLAQGKVLDVH